MVPSWSWAVCLTLGRMLSYLNIKHFSPDLREGKFQATQLGRMDHQWNSLESTWKLPFSISFHVNWVSLAASQWIPPPTHIFNLSNGCRHLIPLSQVSEEGYAICRISGREVSLYHILKWLIHKPEPVYHNWTRDYLVHPSELPASGLFFLHEAFFFLTLCRLVSTPLRQQSAQAICWCVCLSQETVNPEDGTLLFVCVMPRLDARYLINVYWAHRLILRKILWILCIQSYGDKLRWWF